MSDLTVLAKWQENEGRLAVDAHGFVWIVWPDGSHSMAPTNPDNSPTPMPFTFYAPEGAEKAES